MYSIWRNIKLTFDPENTKKTDRSDGDEELYWREELMGEHPILNPIGDPYHPDGL
jgi:hypothetical protein